jgi:hypothetical protein
MARPNLVPTSLKFTTYILNYQQYGTIMIDIRRRELGKLDAVDGSLRGLWILEIAATIKATCNCKRLVVTTEE